HPERRGRREAGQRERRRRDERVRERAAVRERGAEEPLERPERVVAGRDEDERREHECDDDRRSRHDDRQPGRLREAPLDPDHAACPPAISSPISSTVADPASTSPAIAPSYITAIRSASARISSRSSLISRIPTPRPAASRRYAWTVSIAPTSRPRVGAAAI